MKTSTYVIAGPFVAIAVWSLLTSHWSGALNAALWGFWMVLWERRERQQEEARELSFKRGWRAGLKALAEKVADHRKAP